MQSALLLLGPTGSGKTPLGDHLEAHGLRGRRCAHFDFGAQLRNVAERGAHPTLDAAAVGVIAAVLVTGRLLTDDEFPIAEALLRAFLVERGVGEHDRVVLNGLPRHAGQAEAVERIVHVETVLALQCSPEVVRERIRRNTGGDRSEREDDSLDAIAAKLKLYSERTRPLLDHYAATRARIFTVDVGPDTQPSDVVAGLVLRVRRR